mgnify:CR=1 FL=1
MVAKLEIEEVVHVKNNRLKQNSNFNRLLFFWKFLRNLLQIFQKWFYNFYTF